MNNPYRGLKVWHIIFLIVFGMLGFLGCISGIVILIINLLGY
jgi:hypothetical protein